MADNKTLANRFAALLLAIENVPSTTPVLIALLDRIPTDAPTWSFDAKHIKDLFLSLTFEIPALRKELDKAHGEIEALQEQIAGDGKSANRMDTTLRRALHHLEHYASYYHSSSVDEVVIELRQLITEAKCDQFEGEMIYGEPPKWEYTHLCFSRRKKYIAKFNQMGTYGWELIQIDYSNSIAFFKRLL